MRIASAIPPSPVAGRMLKDPEDVTVGVPFGELAYVSEVVGGIVRVLIQEDDAADLMDEGIVRGLRGRQALDEWRAADSQHRAVVAPHLSRPVAAVSSLRRHFPNPSDEGR